MKTVARPWLSPSSALGEIPNSACIRLNDEVSQLFFVWLKVGSPGRVDSLWIPPIKESFWLWCICETSETTRSVLEHYRRLIENFTRYSTACRCVPYCEVKLRPVAHIRPASHPWAWPVECWIFVLVNILLNFALKYWFGATKNEMELPAPPSSLLGSEWVQEGNLQLQVPSSRHHPYIFCLILRHSSELHWCDRLKYTSAVICLCNQTTLAGALNLLRTTFGYRALKSF